MSHTKDDGQRKKKSKKSSVFRKSVDTSKVNLPIIKVWLEETINEYLPDDDIVVEFVYELLKQDNQPDIKVIQEHMDGFLGPEDSLVFCEKLWRLLLSGQKDADGIPEQLLEQRKKQMQKETTNQAKQLISDLRLRPDYRKQRPDRERSPGRRGVKSEYRKDYGDNQNSSENQRRKYHKGSNIDDGSKENRNKEERNKEENSSRNGKNKQTEETAWASPTKTNYNRVQKDTRGTYRRDYHLY